MWTSRSLPVAAILLIACGGATATSTGSATIETVAIEDLPTGASVSEAYRFALRPIEGWQIASESELPRFGSAAAGAAVQRNGGGFGVVVVETMPGLSLQRAAELTVDAFPAEDRNVEWLGSQSYRGFDAIRFAVSARVEGMSMRWTNLMFLRDDHAYRLTTWGSDLGPQDTAAFEQSFVLLDGQVVRPPREAVRHAMGADWRVEDGRFESLASGITATSGGGWRVTVGEELTQMHAGAVLGLVHEEPDLYAIVLSERAPPAAQERLAAHLRAGMMQNLGAPTGGTQTRAFAGAPIELAVHRSGGFEYLYGVRCDGDVCRQLLVWYAAATGPQLAPALDRMPAIEPMSDAALAACAQALATQRRERRLTGDGYAYRGAAYVDFERGLTLRAPAGSYWDITRESEVGSTAELHFADGVRGVHGLFMTEALAEPTSGADYHREVQIAVGQRPAPGRTITLGGVEGYESTGPRDLEFGTFTFRVYTAVIGQRGYRFVFWGWPSYLQAASDSVEALIATATLHGGPIPPYRVDGDRLVDERFGASLSPPPGWQYQDFTAPNARGLSVVHGFAYPDGSVVQLLAVRSQGTEAQMREDVVQRMIARMAQNAGSGQPQRAEGTLVGRPATMVRWQGGMPMEMRVIAVDRIVYGVVVLGRNDGATIVEGFRLLD